MPTQTPLPTYTPFPTPSAFPTYTLYPTPTAPPTYTPFPPPTPQVELDNEPITVLLATNADVLLGSGGPAKTAEREKVRQQIREGFRSYALQRAGIVLTFGTSPLASEGNRLAAEVNQLLVQEYPEVFGTAVLRDYHIINRNAALRGQVEVEVYFLTGTP